MRLPERAMVDADLMMGRPYINATRIPLAGYL